MRLKQIEYHLQRAAHFRSLAQTRDPGPGYIVNPALAIARAQMHEGRAAEYLAAGLRERAGLAQTRGARVQRALRRRRAAAGIYDRRRAGAGKGRGRRVKHWGVNEDYGK